MNRHDLTNTQWERLQPLLPPQKPHTGRPAANHRRILHGMLWIIRTGAPWRDLPERYGPWPTIASRLYRWRKAGIWARLFAAVPQQGDAAGQLAWALPYVDGTLVRAHQHAAGAHTGSPEAEARGRSQGGFSTKGHVRAEGGGTLMTLVLTPGQRHEAVAFAALMTGGAVQRWGRGRPKHRPGRLVGDKPYSSGTIRPYLRRHGIHLTIPRKQNECRTGPFNRALYRLRERVERLMHRLKQHCRLATRYEKCAENYRAMWFAYSTRKLPPIPRQTCH
jgi:transposase